MILNLRKLLSEIGLANKGRCSDKKIFCGVGTQKISLLISGFAEKN